MICSDAYTVTSDLAADQPVFQLSCSSEYGPIREFSCTNNDDNITFEGDVALRDPSNRDNLQSARYNLSLSVTGNYPGIYQCYVTVHRYRGVGADPEVFTVLANESITVTG